MRMRKSTMRRSMAAFLAIAFAFATLFGVIALMPQLVRATIEVNWYCQANGSAMKGSTWWALVDPQTGIVESKVLNQGQASLQVPRDGQIIVGYDYDMAGTQRTEMTVALEMEDGWIMQYDDPPGLSTVSPDLTELLVHLDSGCEATSN